MGQDWLRPEAQRFPGMQVVRPHTWDAAAVQRCVDRLHGDGVLGDEHSRQQHIPLAGLRGSDAALEATLGRATDELLAPALSHGLPDGLAKQMRRDAEEVGLVVTKLLPMVDKLILKLEIMSENCCMRWHQDNYVSRALVSYNLVGTEYIHNEHVDFYELDHCGNNDHVVPDRTPVCTAGVGDILFIKGKLYPAPVNGLVHRSPDQRYHPNGKIMTRLVLKVDVSA